MVQPKFSPGLGEIDGKMISTWNPGIFLPCTKARSGIINPSESEEGDSSKENHPEGS
jgi:hypothetical protein